MKRMAEVASEPADCELKQRVVDYLARQQMPALRRVAVDAQEGRITLRGFVASFYEKQLALSCWHRVDGVRSIVDQVRVA